VLLQTLDICAELSLLLRRKGLASCQVFDLFLQ
jgi:hypothetical protein